MDNKNKCDKLLMKVYTRLIQIELDDKTSYFNTIDYMPGTDYTKIFPKRRFEFLVRFSQKTLSVSAFQLARPF